MKKKKQSVAAGLNLASEKKKKKSRPAGDPKTGIVAVERAEGRLLDHKY
jgi:hypothetical protein